MPLQQVGNRRSRWCDLGGRVGGLLLESSGAPGKLPSRPRRPGEVVSVLPALPGALASESDIAEQNRRALTPGGLQWWCVKTDSQSLAWPLTHQHGKDWHLLSFSCFLAFQHLSSGVSPNSEYQLTPNYRHQPSGCCCLTFILFCCHNPK